VAAATAGAQCEHGRYAGCECRFMQGDVHGI
jgi:hypothetical protein